MSQSLDLPDPLYDALKRAAESSGTTPAGWIAAHLPGENDDLASAGAGTLADLFAGHTGVIRSGHGTLSERVGSRREGSGSPPPA